MKLSIIVPVFNEEKTIGTILKKVAKIKIPSVTKEVIIINDASTDSTHLEILKSHKKKNNFTIISHDNNQGKGAAVRTGLKKATGEYVVIQDADLEYDPKDIERLIEPILKGNEIIVYGSRLKRWPNFSRDERTPRFFLHYAGNKALSFIASVLYGQWVTDMETCYKVFPKSAIYNISLRSRGFEFEPEITAKLLKSGYKIYEIPIKTKPRGYNEGKKLNTIRDGVKALITLLRYRFVD